MSDGARGKSAMATPWQRAARAWPWLKLVLGLGLLVATRLAGRLARNVADPAPDRRQAGARGGGGHRPRARRLHLEVAAPGVRDLWAAAVPAPAARLLDQHLPQQLSALQYRWRCRPRSRAAGPGAFGAARGQRPRGAADRRYRPRPDLGGLPRDRPDPAVEAARRAVAVGGRDPGRGDARVCRRRAPRSRQCRPGRPPAAPVPRCLGQGRPLW